jgi:hypothetical protein
MILKTFNEFQQLATGLRKTLLPGESLAASDDWSCRRRGLPSKTIRTRAAQATW